MTRRLSVTNFTLPGSPVRGVQPSRAATARLGSRTSSVPCPSCGGETGCQDTRRSGSVTRRRRACLICGERFTTFETIGHNPTMVAAAIADIAARLRELADQFERALKAAETEGFEHLKLND